MNDVRAVAAGENADAGGNTCNSFCVKTITGKDIARVLGISKREQGFISGGNIVDRAVGHLLETASPEAYGEQYGRPWRVLPVLPETGKWSSRSRQNRSSLLSVSCSKGL